MSDSARKGLGQQAKESAIPDSQKSTTQKASEGLSDTTDKIARTAQPNETKSNTQAAGDKLGGTKDEASGQGESVLDQAKDAVGLGKK